MLQADFWRDFQMVRGFSTEVVHIKRDWPETEDYSRHPPTSVKLIFFNNRKANQAGALLKKKRCHGAPFLSWKSRVIWAWSVNRSNHRVTCPPQTGPLENKIKQTPFSRNPSDFLYQVLKAAHRRVRSGPAKFFFKIFARLSILISIREKYKIGKRAPRQ